MAECLRPDAKVLSFSNYGCLVRAMSSIKLNVLNASLSFSPAFTATANSQSQFANKSIVIYYLYLFYAIHFFLPLLRVTS